MLYCEQDVRLHAWARYFPRHIPNTYELVSFSEAEDSSLPSTRVRVHEQRCRHELASSRQFSPFTSTHSKIYYWSDNCAGLVITLVHCSSRPKRANLQSCCDRASISVKFQRKLSRVPTSLNSTNRVVCVHANFDHRRLAYTQHIIAQ